MSSTVNRQGRSHLPAGRQQEFFQEVQTQGQVTVTGLATKYGVSSDTVRRDLDQLSVDGLVLRTHGGAIRMEDLSRADSPFTQRVDANSEAKKAIARAASNYVHDSQTMLINGGTTTLALLPHLAARRDLTIVTNNLRIPANVAPECAREVYLLGGNCRLKSQVTIGPVQFPGHDANQPHRIRADVALIGIGGVSSQMGYSTTSLSEARMMFEMFQSSSSNIILCDSSKFNRSAFAEVSDLSVADVFITDAEPPAELFGLLEEAEVQVVVAS